MASTIQHRRGKKETLPDLSLAELGLCRDTEEVYIGGEARNIPLLALKNSPGKALGIDAEVTEGSENLVSSGAVYQAVKDSGARFDTDETLTLENGVLKVNTASAVEADNTLPVTSAAVQTTVGNIEILLKTI